MARDQYLQHLAAVPLFARCSKAELQEIAQVADEVTVPAGTVLARQGDVGSQLFVIIEGTAAVVRDDKPIATVGRGDFVGELAVLSRAPRNASVTAETDLDVLVLTSRGLRQLLDDVPGLAARLLYEVVDRLASTSAESSS